MRLRSFSGGVPGGCGRIGGCVDDGGVGFLRVRCGAWHNAVMTRKAKGISEPRKARRPMARYGIAEWFGKDVVAMTPVERQRLGHLAAKQDQEGTTTGSPECPFLSTMIPGVRCNKPSGVCTIRKYDADGQTVPGDKIVTVCPNRFVQRLTSGKTLFTWIAEIMLGASEPIIVKETPFLRKIVKRGKTSEATDEMATEAKEEVKKAGRIDWILINPATSHSSELEWCALETQALYFSGGKMRSEFDAYAHAPSAVLFPSGKRRPDYRSSGPKRLWPQLDVKVPVLRNWGKKVVVVVDRFFYENMNTLVDPFPGAKNEGERRDNADIAWFIVDYDGHLGLCVSDVIFTTLDSSRSALNATEPLSKVDFVKNLKQVMGDPSRIRKVFKTLVVPIH